MLSPEPLQISRPLSQRWPPGEAEEARLQHHSGVLRGCWEKDLCVVYFHRCMFTNATYNEYERLQTCESELSTHIFYYAPAIRNATVLFLI